eukprot:Ihof_evm4s519 gene=Ihof_evmTU4s519
MVQKVLVPIHLCSRDVISLNLGLTLEKDGVKKDYEVNLKPVHNYKKAAMNQTPLFEDSSLHSIRINLQIKHKHTQQVISKAIVTQHPPHLIPPPFNNKFPSKLLHDHDVIVTPFLIPSGKIRHNIKQLFVPLRCTTIYPVRSSNTVWCYGVGEDDSVLYYFSIHHQESTIPNQITTIYEEDLECTRRPSIRKSDSFP